MSNEFHIMAHGGLCNHLNSLLGGICVAEWYGKTDITIHWTRLPFFDIGFEELFSPDCVKNFKLAPIPERTRLTDPEKPWLEDGENVLAQFPNAVLFGHEPNNQKIFFKVREEHPKCLAPHKNDVILYESNLPNFFIDLQTQMDTFRQHFQFREDLVKIAEDFIRDNNISKRTLGIHFRGGDYTDRYANFNPENIERIKALRENYDNVFVFSNNSLDIDELEKLTGPCLRKMDMQKVNKGVMSEFEAYSVRNNQGALINLMILAHTDMQIYNVWSTFSMWGKLLSEPMADYTEFYKTGFIRPYWNY